MSTYQFHIPTFKIRCSAIGKIMTEPKGKSVRQRLEEMAVDIESKKNKLEETKRANEERLASMKEGLKATDKARESAARAEAKMADQIKSLEEKYKELLPNIDAPNLSQTCIGFLEDWVNGHVYQRRIEVVTKFTYKGNAVEEDAIAYASGYIAEMGLSSKNEEHFENEFFKGTPDVIGDHYVFDAKSSWSHDTFPLYASEIPESDYDWQVLGYMDLTGKTQGRVVFVLMSMPEEIIEKEARWKLGPDHTREEYLEFAKNYQYDDLPAYLRIKEYEVAYDPDKIEAVKKRVRECRDYIENTILPALEKNAKKYHHYDQQSNPDWTPGQ